MRRLRAFCLRLAGTLGAGRRDREIAEELQAHRDMLAAEYGRAGLSDEQARRAAFVEFGSVVSAAGAYRDRRGLPTLESWAHDWRLAVRSLWRSPMLFLSMVLVLGLGIGLSTVIAIVFDAVVWQGLPVPEAERVVRLSFELGGKFSRKVEGAESWFSYPELTQYREATHTLESLAGMSHTSVLWRRDTDIKRMAAALVTGDYFHVLEVSPSLGRPLARADARQPVAVISHRLWVEDFRSDPTVLNRPIVLDRSTYTIVGVAPELFTGTQVAPVDIWLPLEAASTLRGHASILSEPNVSWLQAIGRLSQGASLTTAAAEAAVIGERFDANYPGRHSTMSVTPATRIGADVLRSHDRNPVIGAAAGAAALTGILLLICGSNVAALLLARGATRQKEFALRAALGAGRGRIAQQLIAEISAIAGASAIVGVLLCGLSLRAVAVWLPMPFLATSGAHLRVVGFALAFASSVALLFGLAPARQALNVDCLSGLKGDSLVLGARLPAARMRQALVSIQMAVSLILLVAAALLSRSIARTFSIDAGYSTKGVYIVDPDAGSTRKANLVADTRDALAGQPGIRAVGLSKFSPFRGVGLSTAGDRQTSTTVSLHYNVVDENFFRTLGVAPMAGRIFLPEESDVVLVNASLARKFFGGERAALDRPLRIPAPGFAGLRTVTVVGVVPPMQTSDVGVPDEPTYYSPMTDRDRASAFLIVKAAAGTPVARLAVDLVRSLDTDALADVTSLEDRMAVATVPARIGAATAGLVGILALFVAAVGIHGIVAHAVICRTRDIGVYLALGAPRVRVLRLVLGWTMNGVVIGALVGVLLVTVVSRSFSAPFRTALFGLDPLDPIALLLAAGFLAGVTFVAAYLPARRALGIGPLAALRHE